MYINKKELSISGIYMITCNNKSYIGSSVNIYLRMLEHRSYLRGNRHGNRYLQNCYNKYGENSLEIKILEICERNIPLLREKELFYIKNNICELNLTMPVTYEMKDSTKLQISTTLKSKYSSGEIINFNKGKGKYVEMYDYIGSLVYSKIGIADLSRKLQYSNRSVIRQSLLRGNHLFKNNIIFHKDNNNYEEWIKRIKGKTIPIYKIYENGDIIICSSSSKEKVINKVLSANNFLYYSLKNKCYYTFLGNLIKCPYYKKL